MTTRDGTPSRKLAGVPLAVRRLWSLLYRAERRHAERLDALDRNYRELERRLADQRRELDEQRGVLAENTRTLSAHNRAFRSLGGSVDHLGGRVARLEDPEDGGP